MRLPWFPAGATSTVVRGIPRRTSSNVQLGGPDGSTELATASELGSVANAKPTLITAACRCSQSDRATDASVGIGVSAASCSTKAPLWLTSAMRACGHACAITPATKLA